MYYLTSSCKLKFLEYGPYIYHVSKKVGGIGWPNVDVVQHGGWGWSNADVSQKKGEKNTHFAIEML